MNYNQSTLTGGYFGVVSRNVVIEDDQQEEWHAQNIGENGQLNVGNHCNLSSEKQRMSQTKQMNKYTSEITWRGFSSLVSACQFARRRIDNQDVAVVMGTPPATLPILLMKNTGYRRLHSPFYKYKSWRYTSMPTTKNNLIV